MAEQQDLALDLLNSGSGTCQMHFAKKGRELFNNIYIFCIKMIDRSIKLVKLVKLENNFLLQHCGHHCRC